MYLGSKPEFGNLEFKLSSRDLELNSGSRATTPSLTDSRMLGNRISIVANNTIEATRSLSDMEYVPTKRSILIMAEQCFMTW